MEIQHRLMEWLAAHGAVAGTAHVVREGMLHLVAHSGLPPEVIRLSESIPYGKGMAGLAWEREECVQTCNIARDRSGDVAPGARQVGESAGIAIPIGTPCVGVVGAAFPFAGELDEDLIERLTRSAGEVLGG